jgi:hypothetical protein
MSIGRQIYSYKHTKFEYATFSFYSTDGENWNSLSFLEKEKEFSNTLLYLKTGVLNIDYEDLSLYIQGYLKNYIQLLKTPFQIYVDKKLSYSYHFPFQDYRHFQKPSFLFLLYPQSIKSELILKIDLGQVGLKISQIHNNILLSSSEVLFFKVILDSFEYLIFGTFLAVFAFVFIPIIKKLMQFNRIKYFELIILSFLISSYLFAQSGVVGLLFGEKNAEYFMWWVSLSFIGLLFTTVFIKESNDSKDVLVYVVRNIQIAFIVYEVILKGIIVVLSLNSKLELGLFFINLDFLSEKVMILFLFLVIPSFLSYKSFVKSREDTVFSFLFFGYLSSVITSILHVLFVFVGINVSISAEKWGMIIFFACCVSILVVHLIRSVRNTEDSYKKFFYHNNELKNRIEKTQQNTDESLSKIVKHMNELNSFLDEGILEKKEHEVKKIIKKYSELISSFISKV